MDKFLHLGKQQAAVPPTATHSAAQEKDIDRVQEESDINHTPPKKLQKKSYKQKYNKAWENKYQWLTTNNKKAYCQFCLKHINGGVTHIQRHEDSAGHIKRFNAAKKSVNIETVINIENDEKRTLEKKTKEAELKLCGFIAEHNLPMKTMDHLTPLLKSIFPDSTIAKNLKSGRTKTTGILLNILKNESFAEIIKDMQKYPFSLIIDETTDVSVSKSLAVVVRYSKTDCIVNDKFLTLLEVHSGTAEDLFNAIKNLLTENKIASSNLIGFAADHAAVMMGQYNGVQAKLKEFNENIFVLGCVCHSFHTSSSKACEKLPRVIEEFVRDISNYFSNSSRRIAQFEEFQVYTETMRHKLIKLSCTRWLSLQSVVTRILEQWAPLQLYFTAEVADNASLHKAKNILDALNNPIYQVYLFFLSYILKLVNDMNVEFQSEKPKLYTLAPRLRELYRTVLKSFIKKSVIDSQPLGSIDPSNPRNLLPLAEMYVGARTLNKITNEDINAQDLYNFRLKALDFYISLCLEFRKRFNFDCKILNFVSKLNPKCARSGKIASISDAGSFFPNLVSDIDDLDAEWRSLPEIVEIKNYDDEQFWYEISKVRNDMNEARFPNLMKLINGVLSLPHSSAAAERVFSQLTLIKTKTRNRLYIKTCDALLSSKELLRGSTCFDWKPNDSLLKQKWWKVNNNNKVEEQLMDQTAEDECGYVILPEEMSD